MRWTILAFGKLKEPYWQQGVAEYLKRLTPYRPVEVVELPDETVHEGRESVAKQREGERVLAAIKPGAYVVAMWERGAQVDSVELSRRLEALDHEGHREVVFVIGGANGLDDAVIHRADWKLGLSKLTLPHQLARLFLVEQLYRAERIRRKEPYHK
ncbi:MAG: 23S rRNA (pseudouridine(1915)-N(3))-methyltransferase RlmH [Candidatus Sericytochromatia bacterium]